VIRHPGRRLLTLLTLLTLLFALALGGAASAQSPGPRTLAVVVDRSAALRFADPRGDGRAALAFAIALAARPTDRICVLAPGLDRPVTGSVGTLDGLASALRTIARQPLVAGGVDLLPSLQGARERAGPDGQILLYTADEVDVVDAQGHVPGPALDKARAKDPAPDRKGVNEAACALFLDGIGPGAHVLSLRVPLPVAARCVPFLEKLGSPVVELDPGHVLETVRKLAASLGAEVPEPTTVTLEGGKATLAAGPASRVALLAEKELKVLSPGAIALDAERRFWLVDAEGPIALEGEAGSVVAALVAPRATIPLEASAFRLASKNVHVRVVPRDAKAPLLVRVSAGGAAADLARDQDGSLSGTFPAPTDVTAVHVAAGLDEASLGGGVDVPIVRALLTVGLEAGASPVVGEPVVLAARGGLPPGIAPSTLDVKLRSDKGDRLDVTLARTATGWRGDATPTKAGSYTLGEPSAADLALALEAPIVVAPAATLTAQGPAEPVLLKNGAASVALDLTLEPEGQATVSVALAGAKGEARVEGPDALSGHGRTSVAITADLEGPTKVELVVSAKLARGAPAVARVRLELRPQAGWKRFAAAGFVGLGLVWALVVFLRRRGIAARFGMKQLRGIGSNGKISYERYLLRDHLDGRRAAVLPPGATAVRIELAGDSRATARAIEGSHLLGIEARGEAKEEVPLVHETPFVVVRGLYHRRYIYLEREPTADELQKRFIDDAQSYEGQTRDSDMIVLLGDSDNMIPPSQRLVPVESARLPQVDEVADSDSDEHVIVTDSAEDRVLDGEHEILDPGSSDDVDEGSDDPRKKA
jgi:hypothetical protein